MDHKRRSRRVGECAIADGFRLLRDNIESLLRGAVDLLVGCSSTQDTRTIEGNGDSIEPTPAGICRRELAGVSVAVGTERELL